jgi:ribosomal-protein-alanine N-acetyltransferase
MNEVLEYGQIRIRKMEPRDLEAVKEIDQMSFSQPWPSRSFSFEMNNNPAARMWVAEISIIPDQPRICGMMVIWLVIDEAHIGTIAVHPDFRRLGIAKNMLKHGLRSLQLQGARSVYLEVRSSNRAAQALYEQFGFSLSNVRKGYYQNDGEDALILSLDHLQLRDFT